MGQKCVYFASDFHLGLRSAREPHERERIIVDWLETIRPSCSALYLLGDIFDYWYEYKRVVPKGFVRFLGAISRFTDAGIPVHFYVGNHDVWMFDYFPEELGVVVHEHAGVEVLHGVKLYLSHGDGLGPSGLGYKVLKWAFHNKVLQRMFSWVHPGFSMWLGQSWSHKSRYSKALSHDFRGDSEPVCQFAIGEKERSGIQYFVMGHLHIAVLHRFATGGAITILGDWISNTSFARLRGNQLELCRFNPIDRKIEVLNAEGLEGAMGWQQ